MKENHVTVNNTRLECLGLSLYAALAFTYFRVFSQMTIFRFVGLWQRERERKIIQVDRLFDFEMFDCVGSI